MKLYYMNLYLQEYLKDIGLIFPRFYVKYYFIYQMNI